MCEDDLRGENLRAGAFKSLQQPGREMGEELNDFVRLELSTEDLRIETLIGREKDKFLQRQYRNYVQVIHV